MKKKLLLFLLFVTIVTAVTPAIAQDREPDYSTSDGKDWMYNHQIESKKYSGEATKEAGLDMFYIYPTVCQAQTDYSKEHDGFVSIDDALMRADDLDVTTSGKGAFEMTGKTFATYTNVYAPYYRQANIVDAMRHANDDAALCDYLYNGLAYQDVAAALEQYFNFINPGGTRPYILAGHSQGSAMLRIVMEHWFTQDEVHMEFLDNMVACYAIGFGVGKAWAQNVEAATGVKFANDATSSHVYVSWNTEGPGGSGKSLLWPEDAISVNPLTWTTDGQAGPEMNTGAKVYYRDNIVRPGMYGAQISAHGTVVCPEIDKSNYMDESIGFGDRCLHGWDYAAYWNNIAENGMARAANWLGMKQVDVRNLPEHMYVSKCEYSGETDPDVFDADCNEALRAGSTWWIPPYANALRLSLKVEDGYKFEYDEGDNTCFAYYTVSKYIQDGKVVIETGHLADPFPYYWVSQRTPDYTEARDWVVNHSLNPVEAVEKGQETTTDYGVDLFYVYPTVAQTNTVTTVNGCVDMDDTRMRGEGSKYNGGAFAAYLQQGTALAGMTRVYAPYYRQLTQAKATEVAGAATTYGVEYMNYDAYLRTGPAYQDVVAALDAYFKYWNNGRPFILAGHEQGSSLLRAVLDEYMQDHPEYLQRMVATYAIGTQITKPWLEKYSLKGATGATDTGVVIGWNTEGPAATQKSMMLKSDGTDYLINPLNWRTDETYATPFENLGAFEWVDKTLGTYKINKPGMNDAQIDSQRGALICTTDISYVDTDLFGDKSLHFSDWSLFYDNIRENGRRRIEAYLGHPIKVETADYSNGSNWLMYDENPEGEVDLVYLLPTTVSGTGEAVEFFSETDKASALSVYEQQAKAIEPFANVYVPFYSQVTAETLMKLDGAKSTDAIALVRANQGRDDVFAALDYYFENINWGRPFILASHSQGSSMAQIVFDEYFKQHPDYLERMIAAYSLGCSWPKAWFDANPHARFASDETETGVIIGWNTEGPDATMPNMLIGREDRTINPLNWRTDETKAETSANLGSYVDGRIVKPGIADAQVDNTRGALICTTSTDYLSPGLFGDKSLHGKDWSLYYVNIRENARKRCATFLGHNPAEIHPTPEEDVKPGDADQNRTINVNDYNTVKNYILEITEKPILGTPAFIGADANEDEAIDASDCEKIIDLIFADAANKAPHKIAAKAATSVESFCATANGNQLVISADNASTFMACQMDLGINASDIKNITADANHRVSYSTLANGKVRMLVTSYANETFSSNEAITVTLNKSTTVGIENVIFTNTAFQSIKAASSEATSISHLSPLSSQLNDGKFVENNRVVIMKNGEKYNAVGQQIK